MSNYIEFKNITKIFSGQTALSDVSFSVNRGEIHAILGENGAGKSTLLNILHGLFPATSGKVFIDSEETTFLNAQDALNFGIAKVHQEINVIPEMTVAENIMLGSEPLQGVFLNRRMMNSTTQDLLDALGCNFKAEDKIGTLSTGKKQMVQIAKALHLKAKVISFDEPTSSLSNAEVETLFKIIAQLKSDGITMLYISHKLDEIFRICDRATILRDGKFVCTLDVKTTSSENLVQNMVGRDVSMFAQRLRPACFNKDKIALKVENLSGVSGVKNISFELYQGEILGFFGLVGAMRTETMRAIFGADKSLGGKIFINGKLLHEHRSPNMCVLEGIGLVSENRKEEGFVGILNNADNVALANLKQFQKGMFVNVEMKNKNLVKVGKRVGLTPNDPEFLTASLSGGNAQKVILAKWLSTNVDVLILDEPTKGIDIGAKAEIYKLMEDLVAEGKSIIMVSSELTEVMGMSDRLIIMHEGKITGELNYSEYAEEKILTYAVGVK